MFGSSGLISGASQAPSRRPTWDRKSSALIHLCASKDSKPPGETFCGLTMQAPPSASLSWKKRSTLPLSRS